MSVDLLAIRFGPPAAAALDAIVGVHQAGDPFAPVTVVVADNLTGVMARRMLGARRGVVNVSFVTPAALAAAIAAPDAPLPTRVVLGAAARDTLAAQSSGLFSAVASHPATETALVSAHVDLAAATPATLAELARSPSRRTRAVVDLHHQLATRLRRLTDEHAIARAAAARVRRGVVPRHRLGSIVVFLVDDLHPASRELLQALAEVIDITVLVGTTGVPSADEPMHWWLELLGRTPVPHAPALGFFGTTEVFSATDSDDEVRHVVREILARAERGVAFADQAVLYPPVEPYPRLVHEHLDAAGVPHNGPAVRSLSSTVAGRSARALLGVLRSATFERREVLNLASIAPGVSHDGVARAVPAWERASRALGIVGGLEDWRRKLATAPASEADVASALAAFVETLAGHRAAAEGCSRWPELSAWFRSGVAWLIGDTVTWPTDEARAADVVFEVIDQFAELAPFDRRPGLASLERALETALEAPTGRIGTLGVGVQIGPLTHGRALCAEYVHIVGLAEGLCPAPVRDDTLLPDAERQRAFHGELALAASRVGSQHRALLAARAAATRGCVLSYPRGDHRGGRTRLPSRWLLDAVGELTGTRPTTDDLAHVIHPAVRHAASFAAGLRAATCAAHESEHLLQVLATAVASGVAADHAGAPASLARGYRAISARRSSAFTEWDGNLSGCSLPSPASGGVWSATRLETYASCPMRYFFASVLGLRERDAPEQIETVDPRERGSIVHAVLERFIGAVTARPTGQRPAPDRAWSDDDAALLQRIATEEFAAAEHRGVTGPPILWRLKEFDIRRSLELFLAEDDRLRADRHAVPEAVELAFGFDGRAPLEVSLPDGRTVAFRGLIDRVDRAAGGEVMVYDYKTGKMNSYQALDTDPVARGTHLQLPLYALAAAKALGSEPGTAEFWFVESGRPRPFTGYRVDAGPIERLQSVLGIIVAGIERGVFIARPGQHNAFFGTNENCVHCDFDRVCPRGRGDHWATKTAAPVDASLAAYVALAEGAP